MKKVFFIIIVLIISFSLNFLVIARMYNFLLLQKKQIVKINDKIYKIEQSLKTKDIDYNNPIQSQIQSQNIVKKEKYEIQEWKISTEYTNIFGPFSLNGNFLFLFPDGNFIVTQKERIIKNGKINSSISKMNLMKDKILYFVSNSGSLVAYDFEEYKKLWETSVGLPSKEKLTDSKKYLLFATPTKNILLVHKKTGVIIATKNFSQALYQPILTEKGIVVCFSDKISLFNSDSQFSLLKETKTNFKKIDFINSTNDIQILSQNNICSLNLDTFRLKLISDYTNFSVIDNNVIYSQDKNCFVIKNKKKQIISKTKQEFLYYDDKVQITTTNNHIVLQIKNIIKKLPLNPKDINKIAVINNNAIFLTKENGIYGYSQSEKL